MILLLFTVLVGGGACIVKYQTISQKREVSTEEISEEYLIPGGMPIGIYMETNGVMVLGTDAIEGTDGDKYKPADHIVRQGDYITGINDEVITNKKELIAAVKKLDDENVVLHLRRKDQPVDVRLKAVESSEEEYRLGIWVRDNAQGLGTVTFLNGNSQFGALGHGIHDVDTNELLEIAKGSLYETSISAIQKGEDGSPGGMERCDRVQPI